MPGFFRESRLILSTEMKVSDYVKLGWSIIGSVSFKCGAKIVRLKNSDGEFRHVLTYA